MKIIVGSKSFEERQIADAITEMVKAINLQEVNGVVIILYDDKTKEPWIAEMKYGGIEFDYHGPIVVYGLDMWSALCKLASHDHLPKYNIHVDGME